MIETEYTWSSGEGMVMEKIVDDEHVNINHIVAPSVAVPFNRKMIIRNQGDGTLEFFVVKAPNPRDMPETRPL